jgi:TPR repeat protein
MVENIQKTRWIELVALTVVACALLLSGQTARAQDGSPQQSGVDPVLLAKASAGDAAAQIAVGESYEAGKGVARDLKQAAQWYQKAADKGNVSGEVHLATLYRDGGKDLPRDMAQAAAWFQKAAEQGEVTAQGTMGTLYSMGQGVEQSYVEAYYWLDLAAAVKGPKQAQYAAYRQMMGTHITTDELAAVQDRETAWKAAHPR